MKIRHFILRQALKGTEVIQDMKRWELLFLVLLLAIVFTAFSFAKNYTGGELRTQIFKRWSLVYGLVSPDQLDGQELEKSHIKAIYAFFPTSQEYVRMFPNPENGKLERITKSTGSDKFNPSSYALWVYSDLDKSTEYFMDGEPLPYNTNPLYKGWNLIGITPDIYGSESPISFTLNSIKGDCKIEKAYYYISPDSSSARGPRGWVSVASDFKMDSAFLGMGLAVKVSENCKLGSSTESIEGSIGAPPVIPK